MEETALYAGGNKIISSQDRTFPIYEKVKMTSWLCFYEKVIIMMQRIYIIQ